MSAAIMTGAFLAALIIIAAAVLLVLRARPRPSAVTAPLKERAHASSTSSFDAGAVLISTLSAPIHGAGDGACTTAHSGAVDCGGHAGS